MDRLLLSLYCCQLHSGFFAVTEGFQTESLFFFFLSFFDKQIWSYLDMSEQYQIVTGRNEFWLTKKYFETKTETETVHILKWKWKCLVSQLWYKHAIIQLFINNLCGLFPLSTLKHKCSPRFCQSESVHKRCSIFINQAQEENFKGIREKNQYYIFTDLHYHCVVLQKYLSKRIPWELL